MVIGLVALLVTKPEDLPVIFAKVKEVKNYLERIKQDVYKAITPEINNIEKDLAEEAELMNDYLKKIIAIEGNYQGEYELKAVRDKYAEVIRKIGTKKSEPD